MRMYVCVYRSSTENTIQMNKMNDNNNKVKEMMIITIIRAREENYTCTYGEKKSCLCRTENRAQAHCN